jgi:ABC-type transporter Mla maintaining outer membrane lipid asymmetry ATPase subunit MlaF
MPKCIRGTLRPDGGVIRVAGENVVGLSGKARDDYLLRFGMLFQGAALFDSLSVWENVAFGLKRKGVEKKEIEQRVIDAYYEEVERSKEPGYVAPNLDCEDLDFFDEVPRFRLRPTGTAH